MKALSDFVISNARHRDVGSQDLSNATPVALAQKEAMSKVAAELSHSSYFAPCAFPGMKKIVEVLLGSLPDNVLLLRFETCF